MDFDQRNQHRLSKSTLLNQSNNLGFLDKIVLIACRLSRVDLDQRNLTLIRVHYIVESEQQLVLVGQDSAPCCSLVFASVWILNKETSRW